MYPKERNKSIFYSEDLREIRKLCRTILLNPLSEEMDKTDPNRLELKGWLGTLLVSMVLRDISVTL